MSGALLLVQHSYSQFTGNAAADHPLADVLNALEGNASHIEIVLLADKKLFGIVGLDCTN